MRNCFSCLDTEERGRVVQPELDANIQENVVRAFMLEDERERQYSTARSCLILEFHSLLFFPSPPNVCYFAEPKQPFAPPI